MGGSGNKVSSLTLDGVRFEVIFPITHRITEEIKEGWDVVSRDWFYHLEDAELWGLVARQVLTFADDERYTVLGFAGDTVDLWAGWDDLVLYRSPGRLDCTPRILSEAAHYMRLNEGQMIVGVGVPSWRRGFVYDLEIVRCLGG